MGCPKVEFGLVTDFNTPSQLGRIPYANPYIIIMPSCHPYTIIALLCSVEPWTNNEEELVESES